MTSESLERDSENVTTNSSNEASRQGGGLIELVIRLLERNDPVEMQPKRIAFELGVGEASVRKALQRELKSEQPRIVRPSRGWYRIFHNCDRIRALGAVERIELHGIKSEGRCHGANAAYRIVTEAARSYRNRGIYKESFEGRVVTVTVHAEGLVEVFLGTSMNPMDFRTFDRFCYWLFGKTDGIVPPGTWKVVQVGINADAKGLRMDGISSLSLKMWRNAWAQVYQKEMDVVRIESHLQTDLTVDEALSILGTFVGLAGGAGAQQPQLPVDKWSVMYQ